MGLVSGHTQLGGQEAAAHDVPSACLRAELSPPVSSTRLAENLAGLGTPISVPFAESPKPIAWKQIAEGLELAILAPGEANQVQIILLRINPALYDFSLHSIQWEEGKARTISQWIEENDLAIAINASMYLPDGRTSTAYMRQGNQTNNGRLVQKYGGFFVSGPRSAGLPQAAVLDKERDAWEDLLPQYELVVQNMRLLGEGGQQLWPENGPLHAVAAIAQDTQGNILFLHSRSQINVHGFVQALLAYPDLELVSAIYVEGGSQTALALRLPSLDQTWTGRQPADLLLRGPGAHYPLPNIIGVRPKEREFHPVADQD